MGFLRRALVGAEAGLLAGATVAGLFLVLDVVGVGLFTTPVSLAAGLIGGETELTGADLLAGAVPLLERGAWLLGYTLLHFTAFTVLGAVGASIVPVASLSSSLLGGVVYGSVGFTGAFVGYRWIMDAAPLPEGLPLATVLLANAMAGAVLGTGLHVGLEDGAGE